MNRNFSLIAVFILLTINPLSLFSQSKLNFYEKVWDFGTIEEDGGYVSHIFKARNDSDASEVILDITTSCGCTLPKFSRKPILAGEEVEVEVRFDPMGRPGPFNKELTVYDSGYNRIKLRITGMVTPRTLTLEERYPIEVGSGVRLSDNYVVMGRVHHNRPYSQTIEFTNSDTRSHTLVLIPKLKSGQLSCEKAILLRPGESRALDLIYSIESESALYGSIEDSFTMWVDGVASVMPLTVTGIIIDSEEAMIGDRGSAQALFESNTIKFGERKATAGVQSQSFVLRNIGREPLVVRKVECGEGVGCLLKEGESIAPSESCEVVLTMNPDDFDYGAVAERVIFILNDPKQPVKQLRVSAIFVN